mgnify:CR=1 FL=1|tara:strand:+ start:3216 stop:3944 length:729 start_codon:yes stop_codon:yes gene_type:complete
MKKILQKALLRNESKLYLRTNTALGLVSVISVLAISLETVESLSVFEHWFRAVEYIVVVIFLIEYTVRIYINESAVKYIFSFYGLIDLISFLPSMFGFSNLTYLKSARIIRVVTFLRVLRLSKLSRVSKFANHKSRQIKEIQFISVRIYGLTLVFATMIFSSLLYVVEGQNNDIFKDIPSSVIWTVLTLFGSSTNPHEFTMVAKLIVVALQFTSLLLFGLLINIMGKFLERILLGSKSTLDT